MTKSVPFIIQGTNVILYVNGNPVIVDSTHMNYEGVKQALRDQDWESAVTLSSVKNAVAKLSEGKVTIEGDEVLFNGTVIHNALTRRIMALFNDGFPITHMCKFMERIDANPSYRARNELYGFLEACNLPITDDGCFLAYKKIRSDWKDCYTGTIDNSIGQKPTMPRRDVNEDPNQTCSAGLHVCSYSYLESYGGDRIVAVKVDPADVVAVPTDYNNAKMRVCAYEVVEELAFEAAQKNDVLSDGPSVRTGFAPIAQRPVTKTSSRFTGRLEDIFNALPEEDCEELCDQINMNLMYGEELLDEMLVDYTYTQIREFLNQYL